MKITPDNEAPSNITDHPYTSPKGQPWGRCAYEGCGLAESVHKDSATPFTTPTISYRCPNCVTIGVLICNHARHGEEQLP